MKDNWWIQFKYWLWDAVHGDEWLQPVAPVYWDWKKSSKPSTEVKAATQERKP